MLRLGKFPQPHTMIELLECNYPEMLESAESGCTRLTDCINAPLPDSTTIGKVVDDEKMLRIY